MLILFCIKNLLNINLAKYKNKFIMNNQLNFLEKKIMTWVKKMLVYLKNIIK
ncbi:hypothetical protein SDAV_003028 (plasmid) [Spiroplasma phoeniceum P40]|uniref:Uncharacterized protein n=1 Tax=Spiroplasma phoeniceum P40 TaxID=1276259 RepID=A0A345DSN4_9MOLU|nr:hypothetical protein SDAV_003028 [Spiroplasma phoeniceum P40]